MIFLRLADLGLGTIGRHLRQNSIQSTEQVPSNKREVKLTSDEGLKHVFKEFCWLWGSAKYGDMN